VSEKYTVLIFFFEVFFCFSFLPPFIMYTMDTAERNGKQNKKKSAPFFT
jgi:hypothetical protein